MLGDLIVRVGADILGFVDGMKTVADKATEMADKIADKLDSITDAGERLVKAGAVLTAGITVPLVEMTKASVETAASFEQTSIAMTTLMHSSGKADDMLKSLYDFAAHTPFQIGGILQGSRTLLAMGFNAKEIIPMMRTLGDTVSALGTGQAGLERLIYHFGQIRALGHLDGRILREFGQQGIAAGQMLADGLGKTTEEVTEMISHKMIDADTAIRILTQGMNKAFGGGMEAQMSSFSGMLSNLKDNITYTKDAIGQQLLPAAKALLGIAGNLTEFVKNLAEGFGELPGPVKYTALAIVAVAAAVGPLMVGLGSILLSIGLLVPAWPIMAAGLTLVTNSMRAAWVASMQFSSGLASTLVPSMAGTTVGANAAAGAILRVQQAFLLVAAAMVGWQLGRWLDENIPLVHKLAEGFADLIKKIWGVQSAINSLNGTTKAAADDQAMLQRTCETLNDRLKAHGVEVKRGSDSLEQWAVRLREAARAAQGSKDIDDAAKAMHEIQEKTKAANAQLKTAAAALAMVKTAYRNGAASAQDVAEATERWRTALAAVHPELHATGIEAHKLGDEYAKLHPLVLRLTDAMLVEHLGMAKAAKMAVWTNTYFAALNKTIQDSVPNVNKYAQSMMTLDQALKLIDQAGKTGAQGKGSMDWINQMTNGFQTGIQKMLDGTVKFRNGFKAMGVGLLQDWGQQIDKMAAQWVANELKSLLVHLATNAGILTSDQETAALSNGIKMGQHLKEIAMDASSAAAGAFKAVMNSMPFPINAVLAPAAAAAAYAGTIALGVVSAEGGAVLPNYPTIGLLHPREMVLPSHISQGLQSMIANSGGGGGPQIHQTNNYKGAPSMSKAQLDAHANRTIRKLGTMYRNNALARAF